MESRQPLRHLCYMFLWAWWCITFKIAFLSFWSYWPIHIITEVYTVTSRFFSSDLIGATPGYGSYTDGWNVMFFFTGSLLSTFNTQEGCNATLLCNQSGNVTWLNSTGQKIEGKHKTKQNIALLQRGIEPRYSQTSLLRRALKVFVLTGVKFIESKKLTF